jgi:hypothetical protein
MMLVTTVAKESQVKRIPTDLYKPTGAESAWIQTRFGHWLALALMGALEEKGYVHCSCWNSEPTKITRKSISCLNKGLGRIRASFRVKMNTEFIYCTLSDQINPMVH